MWNRRSFLRAAGAVGASAWTPGIAGTPGTAGAVDAKASSLADVEAAVGQGDE